MAGRGERALAVAAAGHVPELERLAAQAGPETLVHGDASMRNLRTSSTGEIALLDWEDVRIGPGVDDLAWLLVSSVDPADWDRTIAAYGNADGFLDALPAAAVQGILSLADEPYESVPAREWIHRLEEVTRRLAK